MLRYKTETGPGLVALYDIRPGNGAGQFSQLRSLHGACTSKISLPNAFLVICNFSVFAYEMKNQRYGIIIKRTDQTCNTFVIIRMAESITKRREILSKVEGLVRMPRVKVWLTVHKSSLQKGHHTKFGHSKLNGITICMGSKISPHVPHPIFGGIVWYSRV